MRHGPAEEADQRLKQLEKLAPNDLTVSGAPLALVASQKRAKEMGPLIDGRMLSSFGLAGRARSWK